MHKQKSSDQHYVDIALQFLETLLNDYHPRDFAIRLWDGTIWGAEPGQPTRFTLVVNHPGTLRCMFLLPSELAIGEAYIYGDFDIEGDLHDIWELGEKMLNRKWTFRQLLGFAWYLLRLPSARSINKQDFKLRGKQHTISRDRKAVTYHYDLSNAFYKIWLDQQMVYSCAYFNSPDDDIDTAQMKKLDYLCRKLRLRPGERLLDIGCGWGGLIFHAAKYYGVDATGITLSQAQAQLATERIHAAGLEDRCHVQVTDYRALDERQRFDKIVSVGMFEHIGEQQLSTYFRKVVDLLCPGGVFLNHAISADIKYKKIEDGFFQKYVFPDGELVPLSTTVRAAEEVGIEIRDVESLREHYAMTLKHWLQRLETNKEQALQHVNHVTYRVWRIYLAVTRYAFEHRTYNLYQVLFSKPDEHDYTRLPLTRGDWYENDVSVGRAASHCSIRELTHGMEKVRK